MSTYSQIGRTVVTLRENKLMTVPWAASVRALSIKLVAPVFGASADLRMQDL